MAAALTIPPDASRLSAAEVVEVRDRLAVAGLNDDGPAPSMALGQGQVDAARLPLILADLRSRSDSRSLLTRVFSYGDTAARADLEAALGATTLDRLAACNLLGTNVAGELGCPVLLRPLGGLILASDWSGAAGEAVMPPGPTTGNLARALPPPPLGRVLDVGTGSGVLALLAAASGGTVTATDITDRACAFTRFNAAFNGLALDVRQGDLFDPVAGQQFDLVLSQPPFVVQPPAIEPTVYVHGGPRGDELALRILAGLSGALAPGGWALLRFDAPGSQQDVVDRVRGAVGPELDVAVFGFTTGGPDLITLAYAVLADPSLGARYKDEVTRYHRHMIESGLEDFTGTITAVHRPPAVEARPVITLSAPGEAVPRWPYITLRVAAQLLADAADGALLSSRLAPQPEARLSAELMLDEPGRSAVFVVRYPGGSPASDLEMNEAGAAMLQLFAGGRGLAAVVSAYAIATGKPPDEATPDVLDFARDALRRGLLVPAT